MPQRARAIEEVDISLWFFLVGHEYVQHGEFLWRINHCGRYHSYAVCRTHNLPDVTAFAHEDSIHSVLRADGLSVKNVGSKREADVDAKDSKKEEL